MDNSTRKDQHSGKKYSRKANKVQKGFTAAYPTQSSIPYKYQPLIIPESEKKGFNSQAKRFYHKQTEPDGKSTLLVDDIPGPGFYNVIHQSPVFDSVSLSKKGTCTFPSMKLLDDYWSNCTQPFERTCRPSKFKSSEELHDYTRQLCSRIIHRTGHLSAAHLVDENTWLRLLSAHSSSERVSDPYHLVECARLDTIVSKYPAANAYTIPSHLVSKKDFSNSCSSMFQLPSYEKVLKFETPAPNQYNASDSCCKQANNVCARAGFVSKTQRGLFTVSKTGPAPGHYDVNESLVKQSPKILMSCFKSKTNRGLKLTSTGPGPGYYNPNGHPEVQKKTLIPRNPILNFSAQPLPLPPKPPLPGPGQYDIVDYTGPRKHFISSASFVSNTSRWTAGPSQPGLPGPATYKPEFPGKQSFLYNEDNKWIPVL